MILTPRKRAPHDAGSACGAYVRSALAAVPDENCSISRCDIFATPQTKTRPQLWSAPEAGCSEGWSMAAGGFDSRVA